MPIMDILIGGGVVLFAAIVRGFSGFGFSAMTVAMLSFLLPPAFVVPLVLMMEVVASMMMFLSVRADVDWRWLRPITVGLVIGTPAGVLLLATLSPDVVLPAIYSLLLLMSVLILSGGIRRQTPASVVGAIVGVVNGLAAMAGLAASLFLLSSGRSGASIRASLVVLFFVSDLYAIAWSGGVGLFKPELLVYFLCYLLPLFVGIKIGGVLFHRWGDRHYRRFALLLICAIALFGMGKWLIGWVG